MRLIFDIEADGLNPSKVWCIVAKEIDSGELHVFLDSVGDSFRDYLVTHDVVELIGHNIST